MAQPPPEPTPQEDRASNFLDRLFPDLPEDKRKALSEGLAAELARRGQKLR